MNSVRYRVANPMGLHARACALIVSAVQMCARGWEVVASVRGQEHDASSIIGVMSLAAACGTEIELLSLMPDEQWRDFTHTLESLFYVTQGTSHREFNYEPCQDVLRELLRRDQVSCQLVHDELSKLSPHYDCGPFFERVGAAAPAGRSGGAEPPPLNLDELDAFISHDSSDFGYATKVYDALTQAGRKVFLAQVSIPQVGEADFQRTIERALQSARSLVLVATAAEHVEGGWVRAEWSTYLNEHRSGRKDGNLVLVSPAAIDITAFPPMLRIFQRVAIPAAGPTSVVHVRQLLALVPDRDAAVATVPLTPWFDGSAKPARVGVYRRRSPGGPFSLWDGAAWRADAATPAAASQRTSSSAHQQAPWCGLSGALSEARPDQA
jgi:phosphotransferase system HPr (HPr) family protein